MCNQHSKSAFSSTMLTGVREKNLIVRVTDKLANEDTLLQTDCCRHKCFPVCPRAQHLLRTQILCPGHKKCFWFCSETFCVRNKCFPVCAGWKHNIYLRPFAPKKHHEQQCVCMCPRLQGPIQGDLKGTICRTSWSMQHNIQQSCAMWMLLQHLYDRCTRPKISRRILNHVLKPYDSRRYR